MEPSSGIYNTIAKAEQELSLAVFWRAGFSSAKWNAYVLQKYISNLKAECRKKNFYYKVESFILYTAKTHAW